MYLNKQKEKCVVSASSWIHWTSRYFKPETYWIRLLYPAVTLDSECRPLDLTSGLMFRTAELYAWDIRLHPEHPDTRRDPHGSYLPTRQTVKRKPTFRRTCDYAVKYQILRRLCEICVGEDIIRSTTSEKHTEMCTCRAFYEHYWRSLKVNEYWWIFGVSHRVVAHSCTNLYRSCEAAHAQPSRPCVAPTHP